MAALVLALGQASVVGLGASVRVVRAAPGIIALQRCGRQASCCADAPLRASLADASAKFQECGDHLVASAAILGENQFQEEQPGCLSAAGAFLTNAGSDLLAAASELHGRADWEATVAPLSQAAEQIGAAAASLDSLIGGTHLDDASSALEDASSVTGCISLAAAAGPSLQDCGRSLSLAAAQLKAHGAGLAMAAAIPVLKDAGVRLQAAGEALEYAGESVFGVGGALEEGSLWVWEDVD